MRGIPDIKLGMLCLVPKALHAEIDAESSACQAKTENLFRDTMHIRAASFLSIPMSIKEIRFTRIRQTISPLPISIFISSNVFNSDEVESCSAVLFDVVTEAAVFDYREAVSLFNT